MKLSFDRPDGDDAADYERFFLQPEIQRWLRPPPLAPFDPDSTRRVLRDDIAHWDEHGFGPWVLRTGGEFAGRGGLQWTVIDELSEVEIAWSIDPAFQGRGLATEVGRAAVEMAANAGIEEVIAVTVPENKPSERVMQKLGMSYVGRTVKAGLPHVHYRLKL